MVAVHYTVMKQEVLTHLVPVTNDGVVVDCTIGEGGHSEAFLHTYPEITLVGVDRDSHILESAQARLQRFSGRCVFTNSWFDDFLANYPETLGRPQVILMDLGISMFHYDLSRRGFSFSSDEPLDMRLSEDMETSAADVVNTYREDRLADVIHRYGEERYSRRIARAVCERRRKSPIMRSDELRDLIAGSVPPKYRHGRIHPATRTFQALRIEVNSELQRLQRALHEAVSILAPGGRIGVISFHSLEDRIVKRTFRGYAGRLSEEDAAYVAYRDEPVLRLVTKKPLVPSEEEIGSNHPSRSAKLRVGEKISQRGES